MAQGLADTYQALKMALANSNKGTTINLGSNKYGDPPKDTAWARGADGEVKLKDTQAELLIALPMKILNYLKWQKKIATKASVSLGKCGRDCC